MSPYREACAQLENDQRYQALLDWMRHGDLEVQLFHLYQLSRGTVDPFNIPEHVQQLYWNVVAEVNAPPAWSRALKLLTQVQEEKEQRA